jgi:hypothetical protein
LIYATAYDLILRFLEYKPSHGGYVAYFLVCGGPTGELDVPRMLTLNEVRNAPIES